VIYGILCDRTTVLCGVYTRTRRPDVYKVYNSVVLLFSSCFRSRYNVKCTCSVREFSVIYIPSFASNHALQPPPNNKNTRRYLIFFYQQPFFARCHINSTLLRSAVWHILHAHITKECERSI